MKEEQHSGKTKKTKEMINTQTTALLHYFADQQYDNISGPMLFLTLSFSTFWRSSGKPWEARSRLHRRQNFASKYSFENSWRGHQDWHTRLQLFESNLETMKARFSVWHLWSPKDKLLRIWQNWLIFVEHSRMFAIYSQLRVCLFAFLN